MNVIEALLVGVVGVLAGAVVNVLADDLPNREPVRLPHYPDGAPRPPAAWLGISAFLTGHRASPDGAKLSWRHPLVEVSLGIIYALIALGFPLDAQTAFYLLILAVMMLITVIDLEHKLILFVVIIPASVLAIIESALLPVPPPALGDALLGGLLGLGVYGAIFVGGIGFSSLMGTSEIAFGFGDVMLGMFCGLLVGWQAFLFALMLTIFIGALGAVLYLLIRFILRRQYAMFTALPYGPYMVLGTVIMLLWRDEVRDFLLR